MSEGAGALGERRFRRVVEHFTCGHCRFDAKGNGYTDHCPKCLWSRHVDIMPGDRKNTCMGMMEPVGAVYEHGNYIIKYACVKCGAAKIMKAAENDDQSVLTKLLAQVAPSSGL